VRFKADRVCHHEPRAALVVQCAVENLNLQNVHAFGQIEQCGKAGLVRQIEHAARVIVGLANRATSGALALQLLFSLREFEMGVTKFG
jgi:hypothetical protein